ncbi:MAG: hypothetical protein QM780_08590 [Hyphomicrobium sp.]|uniref:hypothetical protein n=1 Tax=Hyphomicrobium sp. TaxID=82 RepID=UPI0039E50126
MNSSPLRPLTAILVAVETLVALFYIAVFHQPGRSNAITNIAVDSVTLILAAIWLVFVLPAIILTIRGTRPELALGFALSAIAAFALSFVIL